MGPPVTVLLARTYYCPTMSRQNATIGATRQLPRRTAVPASTAVPTQSWVRFSAPGRTQVAEADGSCRADKELPEHHRTEGNGGCP